MSSAGRNVLYEPFYLTQGEGTPPGPIRAPEHRRGYKAEARAGVKLLDVLRAAKDLDRTFLSPSAEFAPGTRTGTFPLGGDQLLTDPAGKSWISMEDFAIALVDELDGPRHSRQRFTVGY